MKKILIYFLVISSITLAFDKNEAYERLKNYELTFSDNLEYAYSTMEIVECHYDYYETLDKELNTLYKALMSSIDDSKVKEALKTSQIQWIKFRDKEFEFIDFYYNSGGTIDRIDRASARIPILAKRIEDLIRYLDVYEY